MANQSFTLNIKALFDASSVKAGVNEIQNSLKSLKLPDKLTADLNTSFANVNKALDDFTSRVEKGVKTKSDAGGITKSFETVTKELTKLDNLMIKVKSEIGEGVDLSQIIRFDGKVKEQLDGVKQKIDEIQQKINSVHTEKLTALQEALAQLVTKGAKGQKENVLELFNKGDLEGALNLVTQLLNKYRALESAHQSQGHNTTNLSNDVKMLENAETAIRSAITGTADLVQEQNEQFAEGARIAKEASEEFVQGTNKKIDALHDEIDAANKNQQAIADLTARQQQFVSEVDQIKSRIQYFFGLANAINLVKRAVRGAVDTIKELDKAMTETAVVTDYTVKDMWSQLPEYTKRANELGVTTKDAYESATLYFQQGLNAEQAAALSTETLKMARIAGLDAAEATDRMTNALRGFNMALDEQSAQRVDDVYSQLAAHTASNVDEISTAMTKVASLAHNANMEFETTAAFLAQIIETTRESAETAGTALKTVVARFSEVKKLVDEGTLRGTDEEGQAIDVNKVGAALRTAGIDLNKYFLGEVGLDDIFVELASKWDSLTAVQQRYIATQAAGSRQQSRFIALMQDYARTQELVGMAYDAEGASQKQFEKTQDSLQSKLARLKNAWNEFLMGITNNVMVKTFVDILTNILNFVNKLTSAFGDGAGAVLKFITAFGGLMGMRGLFVNGGIATRAIGAFLGSGIVGQKFGVSAGLGKMVDQENGSQIYQAFTGQELRQQRRGVNIFGGIGNLGKGVWGAASKLGTKVATSNMGALLGMSSMYDGASLLGPIATGLTGIVTALGAIGVAIAAGVAAYQLWLRLTPEGQLKKAQKEAEKLKKESEKVDKELKSKQSFQDTYKEQTEKVENATTSTDRQAAIQERNEAILSAIEEDGTLAQYVITERTDFGIELTVNEEALSNAIKDISEAAEKAAIKTQFGEAKVDYQQAEVYLKQLQRIYVQGNHGDEYKEWGRNPTAENYWNAIQNTPFGLRSDKEITDAAKIYQQYLESIGAAQKKAEITYGEYLTQTGASKDLTNALIPVLGEAFVQTGKELTSSQIETLLDQDESTLITIAEAFSGTSDFYNENLLNAESIDFGFTSDELEAFATAIGLSTEQIESQIKAQIELNKQVQKQKKANIYSAALASGISLPIDSKFVTDVAALSPKMAEVISNIATSAVDSLSQEGMAQLLPQLLGMTEENLAQFNDFFAGFDLNDPINAFHKLNQAKEEALSLPEDNFGNAYRQMLSDIEQTNASIFDTGNLVQTFLTSMSYDSLTSSIEDFIKANGKLTADNIEELADSCSDLQNLLEDTTATAQGLAAAFSLFENGEAPIDALTSSLIAALSAGEDFETLMSNVSKWIKDFDEGTDMKEGTEHIAELAEKATDYIYNWEFGNKPLANIYDHIFGEGAYNEYMKNNWGKTPIEEIETKLQGDIDRVKSLAENAGRNALDELINNPLAGGLKGGITNLGNGEYTWDLDAYANANDAIQDVADNLGVAKDAARAFIESWGSHMWDMGQAWNELNFDDKIKAFSDDLGQNNIITQQELDILAKNTGKTSEEILNAVNELRSGTEKPIAIKVDWTNGKGQNLSGDDLLKEVNNVLNQLGSGYNKLAEKFNIQRYIDSGGLTDLGLNYSELSNYLTNSLKLSDSQAKEVANDIASQTGKNLTQDIQVPIRLDDGSIELQTKTIAAKTAEELQSKIEATQLQAQFDNLAKTLLDTFTNVPEVEITYNEVDRPDPIPNQTVYITYKELNKPSKVKSGGMTRAAGGIVESYAKGSESFHVKPGTALTGEEGPEIVWNKEGGYAYVTGSDGPEFQNLKPGDRVFNTSETKRIFKNSSFAKGGVFKSYADDPRGSWNDRGPRGEGSANSNDKKTSAEWKNELDWLYNLMEDIVELERDQKKFEEEYEDLLTDQTKNSKDLYNLLIQRLGNLNVQLDRQTFALTKREQEMREFMDTTNDQDQYLWYNWSDRTLEIDWDAIDKIVDGDIYKHVKDLISEAEEIQGKMDDAEDAIADIKNQIQELENIWRDTYVDFEKRVLDALVQSYQDVIDNYSELNDTLNNSNSEILDALRNQIDLERQIRDNTETEQDISEKEARLAYLQRDTTGANAAEILKLQKEIEDSRQNYEDTLIDQAIQRLSDDNDAAAKQRDKQIEIMQAQLDYQKENGEFNEYVKSLISSALSSEGALLTDSDLYRLLSKQENWDAMSEVNKAVWEEELTSTFKEVGAYLLKTYAEWNGDFYTQVAESINAMNEKYKINVGSYSQPTAGGSNGSGSGGSGGGGDTTTNNNNNPNTWIDQGLSYDWDSNDTYHWKSRVYYNPKTKETKTEMESSTKATHIWYSVDDTTSRCRVCNRIHKKAVVKPSQQTTTTSVLTGKITTTNKKIKNYAYATGGLNTQTGLAWLDGTPSEPEYVLNARQTQAFLQLADVLPSVMNGNVSTNTSSGNIYLNLDMHVDEISSDYDVDRIANRVKDIIYDASSYRNVNTINFIR